MPNLVETVHVEASLAEVWEAFFDQAGWPAWVDGFGAVDSAEGYPEAGGRLAWHSIPAGRGAVTEDVLAHEHRRLHRVAFADPAMTGELETTFAIEGEGARVTQKLSYALRERGPIASLAAVLFVKGQIRQSVRRSLAAFKNVCEDAKATG